jgi:hypothetical protein
MTVDSASLSRRLSIVVPCHNRATYLQVLLQSLTWSAVAPADFEVIVVNDGGADHVDLVAESWRRRGLDVRVHHLRDRGGPRNNAAARNAGLALAKHPFVLQTDPDIVFASDVLARMRDAIAPGTFCSCSGYYPLTREATLDLAFGPDGPVRVPDSYLDRARGRPNQVLSPDGVGGLHGAFLCATEDVRRIGGYDESFRYWGWEDRELLTTLQQDAGLTRRHVIGTPVVHLWHPPMRGETARETLAACGELSRVAWDVQMQRLSAEYPRSSRLRPASAAGASDRFTLDAYTDWTRDPADREPSAHDQPGEDASRRIVHQAFFDAHRSEAAQLRALGFTSLARTLLFYTLRRPWEQAGRSSSSALPWSRYAETPVTLDSLLHPDLEAYAHVNDLLDELAACEELLGDQARRHEVLDALARRRKGRSIAASALVRSALRDGDLAFADREARCLRGERWSPARAAQAIEVALLADRPEDAARIVAECAASAEGRGDYFEQLRLGAYAGLVDRLTRTQPQQPATQVLIAMLDAERSEMLYSVAMRSMKAGLDLAACALLERFLRARSPAEARLHEEGPIHLAHARARLVRYASAAQIDMIASSPDALTYASRVPGDVVTIDLACTAISVDNAERLLDRLTSGPHAWILLAAGRTVPAPPPGGRNGSSRGISASRR